MGNRDVDDTQLVISSLLCFASVCDDIELARAVLNLALAWHKCKLIPLGPRPETFDDRLRVVGLLDPRLCDIPVSDGGRTLGFYLGRGDCSPVVAWPESPWNCYKSHVVALLCSEYCVSCLAFMYP